MLTMKNITYSFIIPHHNTPELLARCIYSIPNRDDVEIIVVDDNSDEDKKACSSRLDVRIIFIDKEHTKGAGHARNVGLEAGLAGAQAGLSTAASMGAGGAIGSGLSKARTKITKTVQKLTRGPVGDFTNNIA